MTYTKPELVELVPAAQAIKGSDGAGSDAKFSNTLESGESDHSGKSSAASAYQADE